MRVRFLDFDEANQRAVLVEDEETLVETLSRSRSAASRPPHGDVSLRPNELKTHFCAPVPPLSTAAIMGSTDYRRYRLGRKLAVDRSLPFFCAKNVILGHLRGSPGRFLA